MSYLRLGEGGLLKNQIQKWHSFGKTGLSTTLFLVKSTASSTLSLYPR